MKTFLLKWRKYPQFSLTKGEYIYIYIYIYIYKEREREREREREEEVWVSIFP